MLQVVGAGLPRTGTHSLKLALERLLGTRSCHMMEIAGHPFDLGPGWRTALAGRAPDWDAVLDGFGAAVDWPASMFWRELSAEYPDAVVLLSERENATVWCESLEATVLPYARLARAPEWDQGRDLVTLFERFTGDSDWDRPAVLEAAYERHNAAVRGTVPPDRLLVWRASEGWAPICAALHAPVPDEPFPWVNTRAEWGSGAT